MGTTYRAARVGGPAQSIFIATTAYELIKPIYAFSLVETVAELCHRGIPFQFVIMEGNCHVDDARNSVVKEFLATQCTDLIFIDSDVGWAPRMFLQLITHKTEDIVAGAYPLKSFPQKFPVGRILKAHPDGLLEVSYAPTGFMRIPRGVFEKLIPTTTRRGKEEPIYRFFERRYSETTYDGGDVTFCRKWIARGGKVIVDPRLTLTHSGEYRWTGNFLNFLSKDENRRLHTSKSHDPVPIYKPDHPQVRTTPRQEAPKLPVSGTPCGKLPEDGVSHIAIEAMLHGKPTLEHFKALADIWGNKPWAATAEYIELAYKMAMNLPAGSKILECGSGISTIILALAAKRKGLSLITLEHTDEWQNNALSWLEAIDLEHTDGAKFNLPVEFPKVNVLRQIRWYDYEPKFTPDLIIVDGPPHYIGADRLYPLTQPWIGKAAVLMDDASANVLARLKEITGQWIPITLGGRPACAGRASITPDEGVVDHGQETSRAERP